MYTKEFNYLHVYICCCNSFSCNFAHSAVKNCGLLQVVYSTWKMSTQHWLMLGDSFAAVHITPVEHQTAACS